jgi:hypothetical protein
VLDLERPVTASGAPAIYESGVSTVREPKADAARTRLIEIGRGAGA